MKSVFATVVPRAGKTTNSRSASPLRAGFTLIELLVVIAIIAILAAILFPVFAQARDKARQSSCLSNLKQFSTAFLTYSIDYDDTFPSAWGLHPTVGYLAGYYASVPSNYHYVQNGATEVSMRGFWGNSIQTYLKNEGVYSCPSGVETSPLATWTVPGPNNIPPTKITYSMNGILNNYPVAQVKQTSDVILLWEGDGQVANIGVGTTNPDMQCPDPKQPCVYQETFKHGGPGQPACPTAGTNGTPGSMYLTDGTMWIHSHGANFTYTDGHVKWRRMGEGTKTNYYYDPNYAYNAKGFPTTYTGDYCGTPCIFRPDWDFATKDCD